ncbi:MAG: stage III sporulation protein AB [Clostridia bacterium]|nr:stage III sporulation protein AB [Clostridia bacterium]
MMIFKLLGLVMITVSSAIIGFLKSRSLTARRKKIELVYDATGILYEYINQGGCELDYAIKEAFTKCVFLQVEKGKYSCDGDRDLTDEDKALINDFFKGIGRSVKSVECDRINAFSTKIKSKLNDAQKDCEQKCKVYQTFGVCAGLIIGILLI